jgi:hypothetical protein
VNKYITKDSGARTQHPSGFVRDCGGNKPRFDLIIPEGVPYEEQFLTRLAGLLTRGAEKYGQRNWEKAKSQDELNSFKASAFRHFMQWMCGEDDEDHAVAVCFNLMGAERIKSLQVSKEKLDGQYS